MSVHGAAREAVAVDLLIADGSAVAARGGVAVGTVGLVEAESAGDGAQVGIATLAGEGDRVVLEDVAEVGAFLTREFAALAPADALVLGIHPERHVHAGLVH